MQNSWLKRLRSNWPAVLIGILVVLFCSVTAAHIDQIYELQRLKQTFEQLEVENQHQRSILSSDKLAFVWKYCNETTLQCARCEPGWVVHNSSCFLLSPHTDTWERARSKCIAMGADLAVVLNADDQEFLTNLTFDFHQQHPNESYLSAWIGLQDVVQEGKYQWVDGRSMDNNVSYWMPAEPNNVMPDWDKDMEGQDCVAIVSPRTMGKGHWLYNWDDIVCVGSRNFICETTAFI